MPPAGPCLAGGFVLGRIMKSATAWFAFTLNPVNIHFSY